MKPSDLIEWVCKYDSHQPANKGDELWSTPMHRWIPIGVHPAILVSITNESYMWMTPEGLFHESVDDGVGACGARGDLMVVPRAIEEFQ